MEQRKEMGNADVLQQPQLGEEQREVTNKEKEQEGKQQQEIKEQGEDRPPHQKCARCESTDTKFCYYNNYTVKQPRYFCRTCKRYWTQGGSLRAIPVRGTKRSNKRSLPTSDPPLKLLPPAGPFHCPASSLWNQEPNKKNKPLLLPTKPEPSTFIYSSTVVSVVQCVKRVHTVGVSGFTCSEGLQLPLLGLPQKQPENSPSKDSPMVEVDNSKGQMSSIKQSGVLMEMPSTTLKLQQDLNEDGGLKASCSEGLQLPLQGLPQKQQENSSSQDSSMGEVDKSKGQMSSIKPGGIPPEMPSATLKLQQDLNEDGGVEASIGSHLEPSPQPDFP